MATGHSSTPSLKALSLLLLFTFALCPIVVADNGEPDQQALKQLSLEQLGNVEVVTLSKEPSQVWNTPAAIHVITQEDIRRSGARSLPDILRIVPGVEVAQIDGNKWAVGIRGFMGRLSKSVLVLIDGRSVYTPLFAGVYWEAQDLFIEDIERIEVIRGPGGTIWGSNAVNGVINIITKHSRDTRGTFVSAGGGNVDQGFANVRYGAGTDRFNYRIYAKWFTRGSQFHSDEQNFDDWRREQLGFRTDWDPTDRDSVTIQGDIYNSPVGQRLMVSFYQPPSIVDTQANVDLGGGNLLGRWHHRFSESSDLRLQTYYDRTSREDLNYKEVRDTFDIDFIHHWNWKRSNLIWGAGLRLSPSQYTQTVPTVDFLPHDQAYNLFTGFVQDEFTLVPSHLSVTVGTKLEHNSFSGLEVQPSIRLLWTPRSQLSFWTAFTRAVRSPSRIEDNFKFDFLAVPAVPLYLRLIGDGNFNSEKMLGYEVGFRTATSSKFYVDVSTFYNQYDDLLSVENRPPVPETTPEPLHFILPLYFRNGLRGETAGVELSPSWNVTPYWQLNGSYSFLYLDTRRASWSNDASTVQQTEGESPDHKVVIQSALNLPKGFELDLTYRFVGAIPNMKVESYSTGDARVGWALSKSFSLSIAGRNLFQPYHYEYAGNPGPLVGIKRSVYGGITFSR